MRTHWPYLAAFACLISLAVYYAMPAAEITFVDRPNTEFDREAMNSSPHSVVHALASGKLLNGSTEQELLAIQSPLWQKHYGRLHIFGYDPENSYNYTVICTLDGKVASAGTGSCVWRWSFFNNIPDDVVLARHALDTYRQIVAKDPTMAGPLSATIDSVNRKLGIKSAVTKADNQRLQRSP